MPKNFVLEERLTRYSDAIEVDPASLKGSWVDACWPLGKKGSYQGLCLDLGCGKGSYLVESAKRAPELLFVGIDGEPICIAYAAQHICETELKNALVAPGRGEHILNYFGPNEVDTIVLNYPTPFPRKKDAAKRLTSLERLLDYREILKPQGVLKFKTDSEPLFAYTLAQLERAGFEVELGVSKNEPSTEYERRLSAEGARVLALEARALRTPSPLGKLSESLVDYLPQDLETLEYVPLGMRGAVLNLRNRKRNGH